MKTKIEKLISLLLIICLILSIGGFTVIAEDEELTIYGTGLAPMTNEQWDIFNVKLPQIVSVRPNEIALSRVQENGLTKYSDEPEAIEPVPIGREIVTNVDECSTPGTGGAAQEIFPLASAVDVSQSTTFPPIGNQGSSESCVAWSLAYYQLTNNNCVARGLTARNGSSMVSENVMSPRWVYNHINSGRNVATYYDEACASIASFGCASWADFSGSTTISNCTDWSTNKAVWQSAMLNRPSQVLWDYIDTDNAVINDVKIIDLKEILANGYVVTFPTYVNSFVYTRSTTNSEWAVRYMSNTQNGGHAMTVVGYDDNLWVDVNENGKHDNGETGAFKVANSWGTDVNNYSNGFVWVPYDALNDVSKVSGVTTNREPVFSSYYFLKPRTEYIPLLVAEVELTTARRSQISVELGISTATESTTRCVVPYYHSAFSFENLGYLVEYDGYSPCTKNFTGGSSTQTAIFPFDLTDVINKAYDNLPENSNLQLFVNVSDNTNDSYSTQLKSVKFVEMITGNTVACSDTTVKSANNSTVSKLVEFQLTPRIISDTSHVFKLTFSNPIWDVSLNNQTVYVKDKNGQTVSGTDLWINSNIVNLYAPETYGYNEYSKYELIVKPTIISQGRNPLLNSKDTMFYVLDRYYEW